MSRAFVTGGTGFIGRHLVAELAARGCQIHALVRPTSDLSAFDGLDVTPVVGDLLNPETYARPVAEADEVFHLASLLKMPWSPEFRSVHVDGTDAVARACEEADSPPRLILVSSLAAAGPAPPSGARTEAMGAEPVSIYGRAKRDAELAAMARAGRVPLTIVRPPAVFGAWDRSLLKLFQSVARGLHVVPGNEHNRLSLVDARDLARALMAAGERGERVDHTRPDGDRGIYYVACGEQPTYGELGGRVAEAMGVGPPRIVRLPRFAARFAATASEAAARLRKRATLLSRDKIREAHAGSWTCSPEKAERELQWQPRAGLDGLLAETARWYREAGWLKRGKEEA
jgi:dihydroflavonol-4-reductase